MAALFHFHVRNWEANFDTCLRMADRLIILQRSDSGGACIFDPEPIARGHSISRCALLNAPAGSFSRDIVKIERDRVIVTRVCACALWRSEMPTGTVKWFNGQKGFGFIQPSDGGNDVFVHISAVERAGLSGLAEGQKVEFEIKADKMRGKTSAENLSVV